MSQRQSDSEPILGTATMYLSMADLVRETDASTAPPPVEENLKTIVGIGPWARDEQPLASAAPSTKTARFPSQVIALPHAPAEAQPTRKTPPKVSVRRQGRYREAVWELIERLHLELRVLRICRRLSAARARLSSTVASSRRRLLVVSAALAVIAALALLRAGGAAEAEVATNALSSGAPSSTGAPGHEVIDLSEPAEPSPEEAPAGQASPGEPAPSDAPRADGTLAPQPSPTSKIAAGITLERAAADALASADQQRALALYERLAAEHPDHRAYAAALRALRRRAGAPPPAH